METRKKLSPADIERITAEMANASPEDVIKWAVGEFGDRVALASSFGAEDVVLIDMLCKATARPRVFLLDTGRLHQQTYDVVDHIRTRYGISIEAYAPDTEALQKLVTDSGPNSFFHSVDSRRECCRVRKVEPLARALSGLDAWITGLRRGQSVTRASMQPFELDSAHSGILKISPLADWSDKQVWDYIRTFEVPYNRLHDQGFPSIGCEPCTRPIQPGDDLRAGRWWWESPEHKECGLHTQTELNVES